MSGSKGGKPKPKPSNITMAAMRAHLEGAFIGYRPGDPTAATPPAAMPAAIVQPPPGGLKTLDLRRMTMAQLHAEAAATQTRDVFAALLPDPPGVPVGRIAYVTGHGPEDSEDEDEAEADGQQQRKRQKQQQQQQQPEQQQQQRGQGGGTAAKLAEDEELFLLLDGILAADPGSSSASGAAKGSQKLRQQAAQLWAAHGLAGAPRFGGVDCDLGRLWRAVQQRGGGDEVSWASAWTSVAQDLGINTKYPGYRNAGFYVAQWWRTFLQPYEHSRQQRAGSAAKRVKAAAAAGEEDAGPAVPG